MPEKLLTPRQVALGCARLIGERKGKDVAVLDVGKVLYMTEFFVIATGQSDRHLRALAEEMTERLAERGVRRYGLEGVQDARWVLVDFGGVIVHLFLEDSRGFYDLEGLWSDAKKVKVPALKKKAAKPRAASKSAR